MELNFIKLDSEFNTRFITELVLRRRGLKFEGTGDEWLSKWSHDDEKLMNCSTDANLSEHDKLNHEFPTMIEE